jgi:putative copper export protein
LPGMRSRTKRVAARLRLRSALAPTRRLLPLLLALVGLLVIAPTAMAADGVGVYGRTDDKVVTFFAFGLIAFFAILVTVLSLIQIRLDNRKERRTEDLERLGSR